MKDVEWADNRRGPDYSSVIRNYCETNYDKNRFDLQAQQNDAVLSLALGMQPTKVMTEEDDPETKESMPKQVIPYEAKKWFEVEENKYDFTRQPLAFMNYDEDVVRHNINRVKRPAGVEVIAPPAEKEKIVIEPTDFVDKNRSGMREVAEVNRKRAELLQ
jgi:hypothetical protein